MINKDIDYSQVNQIITLMLRRKISGHIDFKFIHFINLTEENRMTLINEVNKNIDIFDNQYFTLFVRWFKDKRYTAVFDTTSKDILDFQAKIDFNNKLNNNLPIKKEVKPRHKI